MNTIAFCSTPPASPLVDLVDLKWLMLSEGHRVDLLRLQSDAAYTQQCLDMALHARSAVLRELAQRLATPGSVPNLGH